MAIIMARRGFLAGLVSALSAPMIVRAESLMPIKVTDTFHRVLLEGMDVDGKPISRFVDVPETLKSGLDMLFYKEKCDSLRPSFMSVSSISWNKSMPLRRVIEHNGWSEEELAALDATSSLGFMRSSRTSVMALANEDYSNLYRDTYTTFEDNAPLFNLLPEGGQ